MFLTDRDKELIKQMIDRGEPLPPKYKLALFADAAEVELIWQGKSSEVTNVVLPFQTIEQIDEPRSEKAGGVLAPHYKHREMIVPKQAPQQTSEPPAAVGPTAEHAGSPKNRISWARLLKRVFGIDVETCSACGAKTKIIAAIEEPKVIKKILSHMGLPTAPPIHPARGPPRPPEDDDFSQLTAFEDW